MWCWMGSRCDQPAVILCTPEANVNVRFKCMLCCCIWLHDEEKTHIHILMPEWKGGPTASWQPGIKVEYTKGDSAPFCRQNSSLHMIMAAANMHFPHLWPSNEVKIKFPGDSLISHLWLMELCCHYCFYLCFSWCVCPLRLVSWSNSPGTPEVIKAVPCVCPPAACSWYPASQSLSVLWNVWPWL